MGSGPSASAERSDRAPSDHTATGSSYSCTSPRIPYSGAVTSCALHRWCVPRARRRLPRSRPSVSSLVCHCPTGYGRCPRSAMSAAASLSHPFHWDGTTLATAAQLRHVAHRRELPGHLWRTGMDRLLGSRARWHHRRRRGPLSGVEGRLSGGDTCGLRRRVTPAVGVDIVASLIFLRAVGSMPPLIPGGCLSEG
jgi:hypothetical protein